MRRLSTLLALVALAVVCAQPAGAVSGGAYTTVNPAADGNGHCKNGNPGVNCNIYDGKQYVWLNGGPSANGLGPDGSYFFAVLVPGGQPNPNDGGPKNLSDDFDAYTNRTFTVTNGEVSAYGGTHDKQIPLIRLFPYADTTNPGGVYIMAICYLGNGYPVAPRDCKYDAFKVQKTGKAEVQHVLSGVKYLDANRNGQLDSGELGLANWTIEISCNDGTHVFVQTDSSGAWSYTTTPHFATSGTTRCTINEVQQAGWTQTGNTVNQAIATGGASVSLSSFVYTVTLPNDAVSTVSMLNFGNVGNKPPECPPPTTGVNDDGLQYIQLTVQDSDDGLSAINIVYAGNATVDISPSSFYGSTAPVTVTATQVDPNEGGFGLTFDAVDLIGLTTTCDPVATMLVRENGVSGVQTFTGLGYAESRVAITNGSPGVQSVRVDVNGVPFRVTGLSAGETRVLDVSSAMLTGSANTISVTARGRPGGTATFLVSN
jgi:hypothetical protein